ncbi:MAG: transketolase [Nitrospirota bacterium]|nr:transketolase [Nitrospirota bacterium]
MDLDQQERDTLCINTIRMLSIDGVQKAGCGHPGTPMGLAPLAYLLWTQFLKHNPKNPDWADRDRFVLSAGHASMLLYSLLHLSGYDLSLDDLKAFRKFGSKTPGHPEYGHTAGVETTTGPLGQGFANAVGMAMTERVLAARFNRPDHTLVDHRTYVIAGDGDLMEGVSSEAASLAGHLQLGKLICFYDDNKITIEGKTDLAFTENVGARFEAYGWHVIRVGNVSGVEDFEGLSNAIGAAQAETSRPSLLIVETNIGFGSPNRQDTAKAHGEALGAEEIKLTKAHLNWPLEPEFHVPEETRVQFSKIVEAGGIAEDDWKKRWHAYSLTHPDLAKAWQAAMKCERPAGWDEAITHFKAEGDAATRKTSGQILNALAEKLPTLIGGSADLAPSNNTHLKAFGDISATDFSGRNIHFGVREHAMGGILNGMALHGGVIPYGGTFLVFSDYMRPAIRLAALMGLPVVYVFTHDSIGLGEDGPTHQPVEHVAALRAIPNLSVIRPADATETAVAWRLAISQTSGPTALILTRQGLPLLDYTQVSSDNIEKGAYILSGAEHKNPTLTFIATGSEVQLAVAASQELSSEGIAVRVVSMPSWEHFEAQSVAYRQSVLPKAGSAILAIEAGTTFGWERYVGTNGVIIGIDRFGASAPIGDLMKAYGFTVENVLEKARTLLKSS